MADRQKSSLDRQMSRVEELIESLEQLSNPAAKVVARELVQTLLALHGAGLARMLELLGQTPEGAVVAAVWGRDDLIAPLLLLHGIHPVSLETRVRQALDQVQPMLRCHGGELELVAIVEGLVRLRLRGSCTLTGPALEHVVEEAFTAVAPDVAIIEVENAETAGQPSSCQVPLPLVP
jgi:Fe-S cluster biogenesis protein NfuA